MIVYLSKNEKRAIIFLLALALLGAGLRLRETRKRVHVDDRLFGAGQADSAVLRIVEEDLTSRKLPIDINSADWSLLQIIVGIGPELSRRIVEERNKRGPFRSAEDLAARVKGIGPVTAHALEGKLIFADTLMERRK